MSIAGIVDPINQLIKNKTNDLKTGNNFTITEFTSDGTFTIPSTVSKVNFIVVGAGGGCDNVGGAGGGGEVLVGYDIPVNSGSTIPVVVGVGAITVAGGFSQMGKFTASGGDAGSAGAGGSGGGGSNETAGGGKTAGSSFAVADIVSYMDGSLVSYVGGGGGAAGNAGGDSFYHDGGTGGAGDGGGGAGFNGDGTNHNGSHSSATSWGAGGSPNDRAGLNGVVIVSYSLK